MLFSSDVAAQKRIEDAAQASALRDYLGRLERPRPLMVAVPLRENGRPQFDADALTALGVDVATVVTPLALQRLSERLPHAFALRPGDVRLFSSTGALGDSELESACGCCNAQRPEERTRALVRNGHPGIVA